MDGTQLQQGASRTGDGNDSDNNSECSSIGSDAFYSPLNSNHATREPSLESVYHSLGEGREDSSEEETDQENRYDRRVAMEGQEQTSEMWDTILHDDSDPDESNDISDFDQGSVQSDENTTHSRRRKRKAEFNTKTRGIGLSEFMQESSLTEQQMKYQMSELRHRMVVLSRHLGPEKAKDMTEDNYLAMDLESRVADHMGDILRGARHPEGSFQQLLFSQPVNSQSKLRRRRPKFLKEMERIESSRNPNNPFQDTSDSELDEVESELELEREYLDREKNRPNLKLNQDGDVCFYCGAITPYEMRRTTPYPTLYQCSHCRECQVPTGSVTPEMLKAHEIELRELEGNIHLNNNGWIPDIPKRCDGSPSSADQQDFTNRVKKLQKLLPDYEQWWERIVEDMPEDPTKWRIQGLSEPNQQAKYWSRGRSLVAGGMSWTVEEGDLFFQGLRRFGKHNVWAIKEHVKSRSLAEVVAMIQAMETELARRKYFGLEMIRLSEMPMAEEADETRIEAEERCAALLIDREMKQAWKQYRKATDETDPKTIKKAGLFNLKTLNDLSSRLYIKNEGAGMERDVAFELFDVLKEWLKPVIKELATLHSERQRVSYMLDKNTLPTDTPAISEMDVVRTLYAQQKSLDTGSFFNHLRKRVHFMVFDDRPNIMKQESLGLNHVDPMWVMDGFGKKYYLNEQVDLAQAEAPDSDQDMATDDGVSAEEEMEPTLEAPLPILQHDNLKLNVKHLKTFYSLQEPGRRTYDSYWSTKAREARQMSKECTGPDTPKPSSPNRRRFRASHPLTPTPMSYETWKEGVERLAANSHALPIKVSSDAGAFPKPDFKDPRVRSINKAKRTYEQQLYIDTKKHKYSPGLTLESRKAVRIRKYQDEMAEKAAMAPQVRLLETYAPGYGILPKNASFMYDPTRPLHMNGYGLGERDRGGLWLMDKSPHELVNASGYITVSDTDDEEEEERGWKRQMEADRQIENASRGEP
ncbi:hypothetical protein BGZ80_009621 [Entomortierella chlamydospora]|uniref:Uncharacterized protein n=1 Tax=Entomortierella chlamydospora TaxID=101097 RepID=A0A9P6MWS9_9FUNG|nr:hypothetical protein BGZ80_009621 [Entomortierella chlamydospora]